MPQQTSLELVIAMATRQRDGLQMQLIEMKRSYGAAKEQLSQLETYASEKDVRWTHSPIGGCSGEVVRHHYQFMDRLQHAMALQTGVIANAERQVESARLALVQAEVRLAGLTQLLATRLSAAGKLQMRREQVATDEFASQHYLRKAAGHQFGEIS